MQYEIKKSSIQDRNRELLDIFPTPSEIIAFDCNVTVECGKIQSDLERKRTLIGHLDTLIASLH